MPKYYPIMLDVRDRPAIVVGGDAIAAEKAAALCASGARVTVLSPTACRALREQAERGALTLHARAYEPGDLAGAFVIVAATTDDPELTEAIWTEAQQRGQLLNVVDVPARCNFILPSILRRDTLTIAVSTEGSNPSLAKRIRQRLEDLFPAAYGPYLRLATQARGRLRAAGVSYQARDRFFGDYAASDVLSRLEVGDDAGATATTAALLGRYGVAVDAETLQEAG